MVACRNNIAKHEENIRKWQRMIKEAQDGIDYQKRQILRLEGKEYYVYMVFVDAQAKYVAVSYTHLTLPTIYSV